VAGKDVTWSDREYNCEYTHVMHINKRDGTSLQGIRVTDKDPYGNVTTITADNGWLDTNFVSTMCYGSELTNVVMVDMHDAQIQITTKSTTTNMTAKLYSLIFHQ
jgi:hypothetical protein